MNIETTQNKTVGQEIADYIHLLLGNNEAEIDLFYRRCITPDNGHTHYYTAYTLTREMKVRYYEKNFCNNKDFCRCKKQKIRGFIPPITDKNGVLIAVELFINNFNIPVLLDILKDLLPPPKDDTTVKDNGFYFLLSTVWLRDRIYYNCQDESLKNHVREHDLRENNFCYPISHIYASIHKKTVTD